MTLAELEAHFPSIIWRAPIMVGWIGEGQTTMYACRICIANQGLKKESTWQWPKLEQAAVHIESEHVKKP